MSEEKIITEEEAHTNPMLAMAVHPDSELKNYLVEYVGTKLDSEFSSWISTRIRRC